MRRAGLGLGLLAVLLVAGWNLSPTIPPPGAPAQQRSPARESQAPAPAGRAGPAASPREPARDLFRYADERPPAPAAPTVIAPAPDAGSAAARATPQPLRLVGFLRRAGRLAAALSLSGEVVVVGPGEAAGDYVVLWLDEERGVRLRKADGSETTLPPPGE